MRSLHYDEKVEYIRRLFAGEDEVLHEIRKEGVAVNRPINIAPEDGKLLQLLIGIGKYKKILEIGTFYGYSTIWLARAVGNGIVYTIEKDTNSIEKAKINFANANLQEKIKIIEGAAEDVLLTLDEEFDMIFIDADKNHYLEYLDSIEKHLKVGGLMVADNTLLSGAVYSKELPYRIRQSTREKMQEFNRRLANDDRYLSILLPAEDGITIALRLR
ncbi:MAG: O-methyltransferase [Rickettsiales bacterium]|jgi:predicted O-methyltransferase YrrM|nr:O-methyltransferase [Rickettsiales bacterium]